MDTPADVLPVVARLYDIEPPGSPVIDREAYPGLLLEADSPSAIYPYAPGSPWQTGVDERFTGRLRDVCLNVERLADRDEATVLVEQWPRPCNVYPCSSLNISPA